MTSIGVFQIFLYFLVLLALTKPIGLYMARLFEGERTFLHPVVRPLERLVYKLSGVDESNEQRWTHYAISLLAFSLVGILITYLVQRIQGMLPFNPQGFGGKLISPDLAFNTAASFGTNTNWQAYTPETTVSYFTQMVGLAVHNFTSAAAGIATAMAMVRGFSRRSANSIGNFWVDVTRATLYLLIPLSIVGALLLVSQGCIQNFRAYDKVATLEGATQTIAQGPTASQEAIKMLGTNGGGFFNANSAHPF
jgi:K+-transporting ATPase ATPase A chain